MSKLSLEPIKSIVNNRKIQNHETEKKLTTVLILLTFSILPFFGKSQVNFTLNEPAVTVKMTDSIGTNFLDLDIDNNNIIDFRIGVEHKTSNIYTHERFIYTFSYLDSQGDNGFYCEPLVYGQEISDSLIFLKYNFIYGYAKEYGGDLGAWATAEPPVVDSYAYLGLKLIKNEQIYYGWLQLKTNGKSVTIHSYGYNTNSDQSIEAGQTN